MYDNCKKTVTDLRKIVSVTWFFSNFKRSPSHTAITAFWWLFLHVFNHVCFVGKKKKKEEEEERSCHTLPAWAAQPMFRYVAHAVAILCHSIRWMLLPSYVPHVYCFLLALVSSFAWSNDASTEVEAHGNELVLLVASCRLVLSNETKDPPRWVSLHNWVNIWSASCEQPLEGFLFCNKAYS